MCKDLELFDYVKYVGGHPAWREEIQEGIILGIDNHCPLGVPFLVVKDKKRVDEIIEIAENGGFDFFQELEGFDSTLKAQAFLESLGLDISEFDYFSESDLDSVFFSAFDVLNELFEELLSSEDDEDEEPEEDGEEVIGANTESNESSPTIYVASPLSTEGDILFVNELTSKLRDAGLNVYSPIEDESINDKSNDPDPEDIFVNDYVGIEKADYVFLVETGREQVGTHVELGIVLEKVISGSKNRVYAKKDITIYSGEEVEATFLQGGRYEYITDGIWYYLISEQGDIETYTESEMNHFFEFEKVPELFVYINNKRLQEPQVKYGKPSASMNQLALGGIMEFGTLLEANNLEDAVVEFKEYVELLESKPFNN